MTRRKKFPTIKQVSSYIQMTLMEAHNCPVEQVYEDGKTITLVFDDHNSFVIHVAVGTEKSAKGISFTLCSTHANRAGLEYLTNHVLNIGLVAEFPNLQFVTKTLVTDAHLIGVANGC